MKDNARLGMWLIRIESRAYFIRGECVSEGGLCSLCAVEVRMENLDWIVIFRGSGVQSFCLFVQCLAQVWVLHN